MGGRSGMRNKLALTIALASFAFATALGVGLAGAEPGDHRIGPAPGDDARVPTAPAAQLPACSNGLDDDGDGLVDLNDPDCLERPERRPARNRAPAAPPAEVAAPAGRSSRAPTPATASRSGRASTPARPRGRPARRSSRTRASAARPAAAPAAAASAAPPATAGVQPQATGASGGSAYLDGGSPTADNPTRDDLALRPGADRRPQLRHRLLRDPALPAADLPGLRHRVRDPLGGARLDQQNRDRLRHQPQRLQRRRDGLDAVHPLELGDVRGRRQRRRPQGPLQPGRRDLRRGQLPEGGRRPRRTSTTRSSPTTTPTGTCRRCCSTRRPTASCPADLVGSLTGLTEGAHFPVAADASYADDISARAALKRATPGEREAYGNAADVISSSPTRRGINIFAAEGAPVVAVNDGVIQKSGNSEKLGNYVVLEDAYGNRYTYAEARQDRPRAIARW